MLFKHNPNFKPIWAEGKKPISNFLSFSRQVIKELGWKGGETCRTAWVPEHLHSAGLGAGVGGAGGRDGAAETGSPHGCHIMGTDWRTVDMPCLSLNGT